MPTALNFTTLQADMQAYLERGGALDTTVANQLPRLINLAERGCARDLKIEGYIIPVTTTLAAGVSTLAKPDRWRDTVSFWYGSGQNRSPIVPRSFEYCRVYWPDPSQTAAPKFYADYDYNNWLLAPTPDAIYNAEILYYQLPPLLDSTNTTNYLTDFAPEMLEYRTFWEMSLFLKNDADAATWRDKYTASLGAMSDEDLRRVRDRGSTREGA